MPEYIVKAGAKAFFDGAIRTEGYVARSEKAIEPYPSWAVPKASATAAAAKAKAKAEAKAAAKASETEGTDASGEVTFTDADIVANPTIQL